MKSRFLRGFRSVVKNKEKDELTSSTDAQPRLVRKPARKFPKIRRHRSDSLTGSGIGGSRRRRNAFHSAFSTSRSARLGRQLSQAVDDGDSGKVREILETAPDMEDLEDSLDVLHRACENKDLSTVAVLLRYGATVNTMGGRDCAPIHIAVRSNCLGIASLLLSHGSYPNIGTKFEKRTPLHIAATLGKDEMVRFLLENNAKVDQGDIYGSTALHLAARMGHLAVATTLLDNGAGPDVYNNDGWTALHLAAESGNIAIVRLLLEKHANVDSQNRFGRTPLHWASACGHLQVVELLLRFNASVTLTDLHGKTALDHAVNERVRSTVRAAVSTVEKTAAAPWPRRSSNAIGQMVIIDGRSRRQLCSSGHISRQTLAEEEHVDEAAAGEEEEDGRRRRKVSPHLGVFLGLENDLESDTLSLPRYVRQYRSWTDCRSSDTDSGRGSSGTASSLWGTLPSTKEGSLGRDGTGLRVASSVATLSNGVCSFSSEHWREGGSSSEWRTSQSRDVGWSLEHLAAVKEASAKAEDEASGGGEGPNVQQPWSTGERLVLCRGQLGRLREAFRSRTRTLEKGMGKVVKETSMALEDGSLKYMTDTLQSTRSAIQSLQSVMDEFTNQFDGRLTLVERNLSVLISRSAEDPLSKERPPLDVFFHFIVSYVARYIDGWRRLIQGLSLPADRECEVLRMVTKAATAVDSSDHLRRISRSMPDVVGHLTDHLLVTDLSVCALSFVQRHLEERRGDVVKNIIRRVLDLVEEVFDVGATRSIVRSFVRLSSALNSEGDITGD